MPNNKGGKKYKRNKNVAQENKTIRFKDESQLQEYAQITECSGGCRFEVMSFDGKSRLAIMCGNMRKRTFVNRGEIVLVSLRDFQDSKCDIIDKYKSSDVQKLKQKKLIPDFIKLDDNKQESDDEDQDLGFSFTMEIPLSSEEEELEDEEESDEESESDDDKKIDINDI